MVAVPGETVPLPGTPPFGPTPASECLLRDTRQFIILHYRNWFGMYCRIPEKEINILAGSIFFRRITFAVGCVAEAARSK